MKLKQSKLVTTRTIYLPFFILFHPEEELLNYQRTHITDCFGYAETVFSYCNNINTFEGGTHLSGFRASLTRTINQYAGNKGLLKNGKNQLSISGEDLREGLTAVLSVRMLSPQFDSQTKSKLGNSEVKGIVESKI